MTRQARGALLALVIGIGLSAVAAAQKARTIAIMPAQYASADARSAERLTDALVDQFRGHGYTVIPMERAEATFAAMKLDPSRPYGDDVALRFGRRLGTELVAYPSLLALGVPATGNNAPADATTIGATVHLRVLNTQSGQTIYTRQSRHRFEVTGAEGGRVTLPEAEAAVAAKDVARNYFERVAGSRQETGQPR